MTAELRSFEGSTHEPPSVCLAVPGALALFAAARPAHAECGGLSITEFVETLYQKQARLLAANTPIDEAEFNAVFSRSIRRLMRAPRRHARNRPIGPRLNAFFGRGVLPAQMARSDIGVTGFGRVVCAAFGQCEVFWIGVGSCSLV